MKLNKEQYRAAVHRDGPMLVLAGPGSGKTHLLVERIRMMIEEAHIPPENILVITFSKKAARQMQARFAKRVEGRSYPVTFGTFHAVFYRILQDFDPNTLTLITEEEQLRITDMAVKSCMPSSDLLACTGQEENILGMISAYKNTGDKCFDSDEHCRMLDETGREEFLKLYDLYVKMCRKKGLIDFDDMLLLCRKALYEHEIFLRKWQRIYRYFLVDEFQDINDLQYDVLRLLAGDEMNVFAVGDDDQSIYAFRGARPQLMKKFLHQYTGCRQVTLTMNYRCCENVIGAADTVIRHNTDRLERPMQSHLPLKNGGIVEIAGAENTVIQAMFVCDMVERLTREEGYKMSDIAVLYRSSHCAKMFLKVAEMRGIRCRDNNSGSGKRQMIHEAYIRAKENRASRPDIFLIMNDPPRGLSREALCNSTGDWMDDFRAYYEGDSEKTAAVEDFEKYIREYDVCYLPEENMDGENTVNVMTAHASKGLEFPVVFIIGLQEGLFPHHRNMEGNAEEERRLMYVAMTRAIERLYMCTVSTEHGKRPSRFAAEAKEKRKYINDEKRLIRS